MTIDEIRDEPPDCDECGGDCLVQYQEAGSPRAGEHLCTGCVEAAREQHDTEAAEAFIP